MALTVISLAIPSSGIGVASDVSALNSLKTLELGGIFGPQETMSLEVTEDVTGVKGWVGALSLVPGAANALNFVAAQARVRRRVADPKSSNLVVSLSAFVDQTKTFFVLPVPTGTGRGASVDVSGGGPSVSFSFDGIFGPTEALIVEGSNDQVSWNGVTACTSATPPPFVFPLTYNFLSVRRVQGSGAILTAFAGTTSC